MARRLETHVAHAAIALKPSATTVPEVIGELVRLVHDAPGAGDVAAAEHAVLERERQAPTYLGHGAALPHARVPDTAPWKLAFARFEPGIPWGPAGERAQLLFLTLIPGMATSAYLAFVRDLGRSLRDDTARAALLQAPDEAAVRSWLRRWVHIR